MPQYSESNFRKLQPEDRQSLESKYKGILFSLTQDKSESSDVFTSSKFMVNSSALQKEASKIKSILNKDDSLCAINDKDRSKLSDRMKQIEIFIKKHALTSGEIWTTIKSSGQSQFEKCVQKAMFWNSEKIVKLVEEWRQIKNRLEPKDPFADDISILTKGAV